jgi:hypothetical protein
MIKIKNLKISVFGNIRVQITNKKPIWINERRGNPDLSSDPSMYLE